LKILDALQYEKNEKLFKLLSYVYLFFEDNADYKGMTGELQYPFKYSKEIDKCFKNKNDYFTFKEKNQRQPFSKYELYYLEYYFYIYEYLFIETNSETQLQIVIAKIISILFKNMIKI